MMDLRLEPLCESNFEAFSDFLNGEDSGCYCSFWHQKWSSMEEWEKRKAEEPAKNKACMLEKVRSRFHLGVLVYSQTEIVAWVSLGLLPEFFWAWRRVAQLGDASKGVAIIPCLTRKTECRDALSEAAILELLRPYGMQQGWSAIEGYPFDRDVIDRLGDAVTWPGSPEAFAEAGFVRTGDHWLSSQEVSRSVYRMELV